MGTTLGNPQRRRHPGPGVCGNTCVIHVFSRHRASIPYAGARQGPVVTSGIQSRRLCRLGAILIAWMCPPRRRKLVCNEVVVWAGGGRGSWRRCCCWPRLRWQTQTQATSTQVVNFRVDGSFCPQHGLYGIAHVTVDGTAGMSADQNFIWTTQTAATSIHSVPPQGAVANVTVVYHCNVQVLWWLEPGDARRVTAALWVNGSGPQPSYTIGPNQRDAPASRTAHADADPSRQPLPPAPSRRPATLAASTPTDDSQLAPSPAPQPAPQPPAPSPSQPAYATRRR